MPADNALHASTLSVAYALRLGALALFLPALYALPAGASKVISISMSWDNDARHKNRNVHLAWASPRFPCASEIEYPAIVHWYCHWRETDDLIYNGRGQNEQQCTKRTPWVTANQTRIICLSKAIDQCILITALVSEYLYLLASRSILFWHRRSQRQHSEALRVAEH